MEMTNEQCPKLIQWARSLDIKVIASGIGI
jgi:hypothetical protein